VVHEEETVLDTIRWRKRQVFGHVCRMPEDRLLKTLMLGKVEGSRQPGGPDEGGLMIYWSGVVNTSRAQL